MHPLTQAKSNFSALELKCQVGIRFKTESLGNHKLLEVMPRREYEFVLPSPRRTFAMCGVIAMFASGFSIAGDTDLTIRGFGTLGAVHSSSNQSDFVRDLSQPDGARGSWSPSVDSVVGLQASYRINSSLGGLAQAISRYRYDGSYTPEVSLAFLKYDTTPNISVRLGRIGTEFYMFADSRWVGYSSLMVRPPIEYYGGLPFYSFDGADVTFSLVTNKGVLKAKGFVGFTGAELRVGGTKENEASTWNLSNSPMFGGYLDYTQGAWQFRSTYTKVQFSDQIPSATLQHGLRQASLFTGDLRPASAADALIVKNRSVQYYSAGVVYEDGSLQAQLMLSRAVNQSAAFENADSAYGMLGYRFSSLTPYLGYSTARSKPKKIETGLTDYYANPIYGDGFRALNAGFNNALDGSHISQSTTFAGLRWDFRTNAAIKLQFDSVRGSHDSNQLVQRESPLWNGKTNLVSMTLDFVF